MSAGLWIIVRAAGLFAQRIFAPLVTIGMIAIVLMLQQQQSALSPSHLWGFSPLVFVAMLCTVLCLDIAELLVSPVADKLFRRLRRWNWHRIAVWAFGLAFLTYVIVVPLASSFVEALEPADTTPPVEDELTLGAKIALRTMEALTAFVFFALGATIGSFLNVVVFRMPRGESVVMRPSRCPQCETKIRGRDNVPILGWLLLNGRCRECRIPISPRYPIVESASAAIFALLYFAELISGGENIPVRWPNSYNGVVWIIFYTKWDLVALYAFHCFTLSTLLTWALVDVDRQRIPWWAIWCVGAILLALPSLNPNLLPVTYVPESVIGRGVPKRLTAALTSVLGGLVGLALGWFGSWALGTRRQRVKPIGIEENGDALPLSLATPRGHLVSASMIAGLSVGWQATVGVWLMTFAIRPIVSFGARRFKIPLPPASTVLLIAYLIHLVCWRLLNTSWWPSATTTSILWVIWCVTLGAICLAYRFLSADCQPDGVEHCHESADAITGSSTYQEEHGEDESAEQKQLGNPRPDSLS